MTTRKEAIFLKLVGFLYLKSNCTFPEYSISFCLHLYKKAKIKIQKDKISWSVIQIFSETKLKRNLKLCMRLS